MRALVTLIADEDGNAHFSYVPDAHLIIESGHGSKVPIVDGQTLKQGDGYTIRNDATDPPQESLRFSVLGISSVPDASLYKRQRLRGIPVGVLGLDGDVVVEDGFQYIEVRDGVTLSAMIRLPDPGLYGPGPYPTVIEYSGYSPSRPDSPPPGARIANMLGYATVGVNMRGTGCSGGVFDVFNPAQHADGYDIVEAVARQHWVLHGKVGMVGLSYSGISQLFVASTRPPSLAAITPQSVIADPWEMQWPGGIYNSGFTRQWIGQRDSQARAGGMSWVGRQLDGGDDVCAENQKLRGQNIDFESFLHGLEFRPRDAEDRSLPSLVRNVDVPVYLTGAFQDEQTGALFGGMVDRFTSTDCTKFTMYNGRHPDGYSPLVVTRWYEFLEFYVAQRVPKIESLVRFGADAQLPQEFNAPGIRGFEADRFMGDYAAALAAYEAEPTVRVIFENGAGDAQAGAPVGRYEASFATWPPPGAVAKTWYFGGEGRLAETKPPTPGADRYLHDPAAGERLFFGSKGYQMMVALWDIDWSEFEPGRVLSYVSEPLTEDTVIAGVGRADLWVRTEVEDAQVQISITEVRSDDIETLVQSGWLRLGHRQHTDGPDGMQVVRSYSKEAFAPMPIGEFVPVAVEIPSVAHAFRAGSRLRVTISSPGRNHGTWAFEAPDYGGSEPAVVVARSSEMPSSVRLPVISGVDVAAGYPPCPSLRGQPCRPYRPVTNTDAN